MMQIVVLCNSSERAELGATGLEENAEVIYAETFEQLIAYPAAAAYLDLLFEKSEERIERLKSLHATVIINSVIHTLSETDESFVRINGWPTFLKGALIEAACLGAEKRRVAEEIMALFNKKIEWLPDEAGFITPRVICQIINEAYFALSEGISTREEIDVAMKLGTAYPHGPFEWGEKIGLQRILKLLSRLSESEKRYTAAPLLQKEAIENPV